MNDNIPLGYSEDGEFIGQRDERIFGLIPKDEVSEFEKKMDTAEDIYTAVKDGDIEIKNYSSNQRELY